MPGLQAQWKNTRFVIFYYNRPWSGTRHMPGFFQESKNKFAIKFDFESLKDCREALGTLNPRHQKAVATDSTE